MIIKIIKPLGLARASLVLSLFPLLLFPFLLSFLSCESTWLTDFSEESTNHPQLIEFTLISKV